MTRMDTLTENDVLTYLEWLKSGTTMSSTYRKHLLANGEEFLSILVTILDNFSQQKKLAEFDVLVEKYDSMPHATLVRKYGRIARKGSFSDNEELEFRAMEFVLHGVPNSQRRNPPAKPRRRKGVRRTLRGERIGEVQL